ncbi:autotransporter outer membrane beta-barrel domain-containing protein [Bartonella birtlesii]|uniref:autotransporter outer membrane beta-barrel domain-containing protein n=3 Tax=Bartonella birtlesii TaxID=111504 RepID=UPI00036504C4|nr:autotransporter outer membrane beta-barrel domain-containing protein [Bartonella birtlesii]
MYKKSLLSSIATAAIVLFNIQFNVHAESLESSGEKKEVKDATYETLHALKEGQIIGTDLKVTGNKDTNSSSNTNIYVISVEGKDSAIKLTGDKTIIQGTDSDIRLGLEAKENAILQMTGGTVTVSDIGVHFSNSNSSENKLENVTISSGKKDAFLTNGINTNNSTVALNNITVTQAGKAIVADNESTITVSGGSFNAKEATITANNNSTITLTNDAHITSSENSGLLAQNGGAISMTGGTIQAAHAGADFKNSKSEKNKLENVTISSGKADTLLENGILAEDSTVALKNVTVTQAGNAIVADNESTITVSGGSFNAKEATIVSEGNSIITLTDNAQITSSENYGLLAQNGGAINMTGGAIQAATAGAGFKNSKSEKNKLENVTISSSKADTLLTNGIFAEDSTVALKNVTVTQAGNAIVADNESTITVSGGSFNAKKATIVSEGNSIITLTDNAHITSSENYGLLAQNGGAINMTGGAIQAALTGAGFKNSKSEKNKLENVTISSSKADTLLTIGILADNSTVALKNVTVTQAGNAISVDNDSTITVSGGSFNAKDATIVSKGDSIITLTDNAQITSSENAGLLANENGAISMTGGTIQAALTGAGFQGSKSEKNKLENVTISSSKADTLLTFGILADNSTVALKNVTVTQAGKAISVDNDSTITVSGGSFETKDATIVSKGDSSITLTDNAHITSSENAGLLAQNGGAINMTGGTIKAATAGADFQGSKSENNKLKDVTISSSKADTLLTTGIHANKSTVDLDNITVTNAEKAIVAEDKSTITVSGGSFETKNATIIADDNSSITLTNDAHITSSENAGLLANENGAISMTGGTIKAATAGANFQGSNKAENKLENVTISSSKKDASSGKDDTLLTNGILADDSTVTLNNVTVTQARNAISADNESTIKVSGGSFDAKTTAIVAQNDSSITLNDTTVTSSHENGVHAQTGSKITITGGSVTTKSNNIALFAEKTGQIDATNITLTTNGKGTGATALGSGSKIKLHGKTTINNTLNGLYASNGGKITSENLTVIGNESISSGSETKRSGITTNDSKSEINLTGTTIIQNVDEGLYADDGSKITSGDLTITGGKSKDITSAVNSFEPKSKIELNGKTTIKNFDVGLFASNNASIKMKDGTKNEIDVKKVALMAVGKGKIDLKNTFVKAENIGIELVALSETNANGSNDPQTYENNEINLTKTNIHVDNGTGILIGALVEKSIENNPTLSIGTANLEDSEIHADVLLDNGVFWDTALGNNENSWNDKTMKKISSGTFTLNANHSILEGKANIVNDRTVRFDLTNQAQWILKTSTQEKDAAGNLLDIAQRSRSDISVLNLNDSSIVFKEPTEGHYHTLHIGSGNPNTKAVYNARGDAKIYFNTKWTNGKPIAEQETDHLLIHGDVSGSTTVYIASDLGDKESAINASNPSNISGLSLIQVSGKADENSFKLAHGYTTRGGSPYKYTLTGYGLESSHGKANIEQNLFDEKNENFWDFRLHKNFLGPDPIVEQLVPQTASYLVMPNALFYSGLTDMTEQNALLANLRTSVVGKRQGREQNNGFFLHTYGNTGTLSSARGALEYGYGAHIRYAALQGGVNFTALEGHNTTVHFGLAGTYGQLSFTPKDMQDAGKNTIDKWSLTAYSTLQHDNGFYLDTLLSYGILKGEITNALIGTTAKLKNAKMLSISTTIGKQFATGMEGLTFEPQAQVAYQHLMFDTISDADKFTVDMNDPHQWIIRIGGRLTKTVVSAENGRAVSFYGKVNALKTLNNNQVIYIDKDYKLDPMGSSLEGGFGINAQLSQNVSLQGDVSYQQKLQKTGISGASFSGGIRYQF